MTNPFANRTPPLSGPATDIVPVSPDDNTEMPHVALALYVESGGMLSMVTLYGQTRVVEVADHMFLPVACRAVNATGTTASGIHAMVLA